MTRAEKVSVIRRLRSQGLTNGQIAWKLGWSESTVRGLLYDPDGSKQKERRLRLYSRPCVDCGKPTDGSCGYVCGGIPRCAACTAIYKKQWTREAVLAAIQLWAEEHGGRPPLAADWINASGDGRFPCRNNVYRSASGHSTSPFESWADAIEAAGFPRPRPGIRTPEGQGRVIAAQVVYTPSSVQKTIRTRARNGRVSYGDVPQGVYTAARRFFGSWQDACHSVGLKTARER